jgi:glycosyltransferase involved in cell wall biosynthesis
MSGSPEISIVMSVYNGADQLRETIDSVLSQQGVSLEFIVVDDGSTDGSDVIIASYARHDPRIRILRQENQGLTRALIKGCDAAKGKYVARQDAGDISLPDRLRLLKAFLDRYEDCAFVSSWTSVIGPKDEYLFLSKGKGLAASPIWILSKRSQKWVVIQNHGSVMFRREAYVKAGGLQSGLLLRSGLGSVVSVGNARKVCNCRTILVPGPYHPRLYQFVEPRSTGRVRSALSQGRYSSAFRPI